MMRADTKNHSSEQPSQLALLGANIVRDNDNIVSDMGEEKVILSVKNGKYYNLGIMGSQIWELIQEPILVEQLIEQLTEQYDVERTVCEEQVLPFLLHLSEEKLIHIQV